MLEIIFREILSLVVIFLIGSYFYRKRKESIFINIMKNNS